MRIRTSVPDASSADDVLLAACSGSSVDGDVLREGLAVGQGKWPTDRYLCARCPGM